MFFMLKRMAPSWLITALFVLVFLNSHSNSSALARKEKKYVKDACRVTLYPALCIRSLSSFSGSAKQSPYRWARAAVSVTLAEAEATGRYLSHINRTSPMKGSAHIALIDCIECFQDTVDQLHNSLAELRKLNHKTFAPQISNVETWVSSALTYEGTCLDGFDERKGTRIVALRSKVMNASRFTSNALALVNRLASTGG